MLTDLFLLLLSAAVGAFVVGSICWHIALNKGRRESSGGGGNATGINQRPGGIRPRSFRTQSGETIQFPNQKHIF